MNYKLYELAKPGEHQQRTSSVRVGQLASFVPLNELISTHVEIATSVTVNPAPNLAACQFNVLKVCRHQFIRLKSRTGGDCTRLTRLRPIGLRGSIHPRPAALPRSATVRNPNSRPAEGILP